MVDWRFASAATWQPPPPRAPSLSAPTFTDAGAPTPTKPNKVCCDLSCRELAPWPCALLLGLACHLQEGGAFEGTQRFLLSLTRGVPYFCEG
jgi:hypothetical protein